MERFDYRLERYGQPKAIAPIADVEEPQISALTLLELWQQYFCNKQSKLKPKTIEKYDNFTILYAKVGDIPLHQALAVKQKLEQVTTIARTKDALMYLSSACSWGMKYGLVSENPYEGMSKDLPQHQHILDPQPNAFTVEERNLILEKFRTDKRRGMNYRPYAPFVEFLFFIGCRPSEAVGLRWKHISADFDRVHFNGALVQVRNRRVPSKGSKNNRTRTLALSKRLQALLRSIKPENAQPEDLVFPSSRGDNAPQI